MSDPRNVAHAKKVAEEKKHHGDEVKQEDGHAVQPGKKPAAAKKKKDPAGVPAVLDGPAGDSTVPGETAAPTPPAALQGSLAVLARFREMEAHSRANLERLAQLTMTVEDELKQQELVAPLGEVYSAQNAFQSKLTALIESYKAECDRLQSETE
jgi:hypothetical protein